MNGNGVNTLEYAEELKKAGVPDAQALAQARLLYEIIGSSLATKRDITELKRDIEISKAELKRDIKELDGKIETTKAELKREIKALDDKIETTKAEIKRDIKELDGKIETTKAELKREIKALDDKIMFRMAAASAGVVLTILSCLVTLGKLGLLTPTPTP